MTKHAMCWCSAGALAATFTACGSVKDTAAADAAVTPDAVTADATVMADAPPDGFPVLPSCKPVVAEISKIENSDPGYGNGCIRGAWTLQAFNGTTTPVTAGQPNNNTLVAPISITGDATRPDMSSTFAVHVSGAGQMNPPNETGAYAQLTASLNQGSDTDIGTVDASDYIGIQFYAKLTTGDAGARLTVGNLFTDPAGGRCVPDGTDNTGCYDNPGAQLVMSAEWKLYQVPFDSLEQLGYGLPIPKTFPKSAITHIKWDIGIPMMGATPAWDLWVDDLTFY
jgi:hypothetical protein